MQKTETLEDYLASLNPAARRDFLELLARRKKPRLSHEKFMQLLEANPPGESEEDADEFIRAAKSVWNS